jgi:hypothetical protein
MGGGILVACVLSLGTGRASAQERPGWILGNETLGFPEQVGPVIQVTPLPIPNDPGVSTDLQYAGVSTLRSAIRLNDQFGALLAFLVDGRIYDREGYLLADRSDAGCQECLPWGITHAVAVHRPGSCYQYLLFTEVLGTGGGVGTVPYQVYCSVLDLALPNPKFDPIDHPYRRGRLLDLGALELNGYDFPDLGASFLSSTVWSLQVPGTANFNNVAGHMDAVDLGHDQAKFLFITTGNIVTRYRISSTDLSHLGDESIALDPNWTIDEPRWPTGELEAIKVGNEIRVAFSGFGYDVTTNPYTVGHWMALRRYTLAGAPITDQRVLLDSFLYSTLQDASSHLTGLAFEPTGTYVYFARKRQPRLGAVEFSTGAVTFTAHDIGDHRFSQLEAAPDDQDPSQAAIYALSPAGAFGRISDIADPTLCQWTPSVAMITAPATCAGVDDAQQYTGPADDYYTLPQSVIGLDAYGPEHPTLCCVDMVEAEGHTISAAVGNASWVPGSNPFLNTVHPIIVRLELRIPAGAHVTANNLEFRFGPGATLVIEPGGSFTASSCTFINACPEEFWQGIEVRGNVGLHQYGGAHPGHQGHLVLGTGCTVENAEMGILASKWPVTDFWNFLYGGGVVECAGTTFRNCREGLRVHQYQGYLPGTTTHTRNRSYFRHCTFTVDEQYPGTFAFLHHARLHKVDGILFKACTFENTVSDAFADTHGGSQALGHGIYSMDADYLVEPGCSVILNLGDPCPPQNLLPCRFIGLDHGIHALASTTTRRFSVTNASFENNICGVYTAGVIRAKVVDNDFVLGKRDVNLIGEVDQEFIYGHRGIYTFGSYGSFLDDNTLGPDPLALSIAEGIVVGYSRDHNDMVWRNTAGGLENAYVGEGVCADPNLRSTIGLHFYCNTNNNNQVGIWSRKVDLDPGTAANQTIRTIQGSIHRSADNTFDRTPGQLDIKNTNGQSNSLQYWWADPAVPYDPLYNTPNFVQDANESNGDPVERPLQNCAHRNYIIIDGVAGGHMHLANEKMAYGNARYLYDQLIDGV